MIYPFFSSSKPLAFFRYKKVAIYYFVFGYFGTVTFAIRYSISGLCPMRIHSMPLKKIPCNGYCTFVHFACRLRHRYVYLAPGVKEYILGLIHRIRNTTMTHQEHSVASRQKIRPQNLFKMWHLYR